MRFYVAILGFFLVSPLSAAAHPHIFIEARLEVLADQDGAISEIQNVWRFDEMFSSSVIIDFDKNSDLKLDSGELSELSETMRTSLAQYGYFVNITASGEKIGVREPDALHVSLQGNQLIVIFAVKPEKPVAMSGRLILGVYDPTMYTSIDFATDDDLVTKGKAFGACKRKVVRPDPDEIIAQNSATLTDAFFNDPSGTDASRLFATRLEVEC